MVSGFLFSSSNGPVSWRSKKQSSVAAVPAEAKYLKASSAKNKESCVAGSIAETTGRAGGQKQGMVRQHEPHSKPLNCNPPCTPNT
jgi:hypothetical protein